MGLTNFFLDYFPMYAKFRTVASILVIAEFTIPLLAMMGLKAFMDNDDPAQRKKLYRAFGISFALTGGACLLFALMPKSFFLTRSKSFAPIFMEISYLSLRKP